MENEEKEDASALSIFFYALFLCLTLYVIIGRLIQSFYLIRFIFSSIHSFKDVVTCFVSFVIISVVLMLMAKLPFQVIGFIVKSIAKTSNTTENTPKTQKIVAKPFQKFATTTNNIHFSFNQFTYTDNNETQSFQLASIYKIVLFGNNSQNKSLNIYYDKDKIYTFYSDMKDWIVLLERLNAHFGIKIDAKTNNNKQILYERKS
jgi:hypothetical protein